MSSRLRKLIEDSNQDHQIQSMVRHPVAVHLSMEEIKRYMDSEHDEHLIAQWASAYTNAYNQKWRTK
jgi:hypothetical protein